MFPPKINEPDILSVGAGRFPLWCASSLLLRISLNSKRLTAKIVRFTKTTFEFNGTVKERIRMRKAIFAFALVAFLAPAQSPAQGQDFSKVEMKVQKVAGTVYMLQGQGGNIGASVGDDGIVVVDDEYLPLAEKIEAALKGIADKPVKVVLNTHWHGDHTCGNPHFGQKAPIVAQENVRKRLASGGKTRFGETKPADKIALPIITFEDKVSVHLNGEDIHAIHFPNGHTDGDSVIFFKQSNVVHMGDDFFNGGMFPFIDIDSGGSVQGMIAGDEKVLAEVPDDVKN